MATLRINNLRARFSILFVAVLASLFPSTSFGQATLTGVLVRGTVQDASSAGVPRAAVSITNEATGVSERTISDEGGRYLFNTLQPATYSVKVEAPGFKTVFRPNVVLRVGQQIDLDFTLEVGEVTTTVQVTAVSPLLNSVSAALGQEVDNHYITEIPLPDRQILGLAYLAPGVTEIQNATPFGTSGINFVSNGQRYSTAEVRMDGSIIGAAEGGEGQMYQVLFQPSPDAVQEFKVQNNSFSAEYGNNGGTVINMITKSGTNEFHGSGYWFGRRPQLDANTFFANRDGLPKPNFNRDQYGGTIGGPVFKQKTFFFFDYDRVRLNSLATLLATVPTELQRRGDFSQTFNPDGSLVQIFNPLDVHQDANGDWIRSPFPGNVIPASLMDPVAVNLLKFYPLPTGPGDPVTGLNNYSKSGTQSNPTWQYDLKIDHNLSERSRLSARYTHVYQSGLPPAYIYESNPFNYGVTANKLNNAVIQHVYTFNPTTVWANQFALERAHNRADSPDFDFTSVGFPSIMRSTRGAFPLIILGDYGATSWFTQGAGTGTNAHTLPHWSSSMTKVRGGTT